MSNNNSKKHPSEKDISVPLAEYFQALINYREWAEVSKVRGEIIAALDDIEFYVHVQFKTFDGSELERPRVWWIKAYKSDYLKWQLDRERAARERKENCLFKENTARLIKAMCAQYGFNSNEDAELFRKVSEKISRAKHDKAAANFRVIIDRE